MDLSTKKRLPKSLEAPDVPAAYEEKLQNLYRTESTAGLLHIPTPRSSETLRFYLESSNVAFQDMKHKTLTSHSHRRPHDKIALGKKSLLHMSEQRLSAGSSTVNGFQETVNSGHGGVVDNPPLKRNRRKQTNPRKRIKLSQALEDLDSEASELIDEIYDSSASYSRFNSSDEDQFSGARSDRMSLTLQSSNGGLSKVIQMSHRNRASSRDKRKQLRLFGKQYTTPSGKTYPERKVREKDCSNCRYACSHNISSDQRQDLFDQFWNLDSYVKRLHYYCQSIKEKPARTMTHTRECSREYTFMINGERIRVCKGFYLATLDVSDKAVRIAMEKRKKGRGMWDKRGSHPPHNKTTEEVKDRIRRHIESCHGNAESMISGEKSRLEIVKMYQLYLQECLAAGCEPVSEDVYRKTFNSEYCQGDKIQESKSNST